MTTNVNFLKNIPTLSEREYLKERLYFKYSIVFGIFTILSVIVLIIWQLTLTRKFKKIEERIDTSNKRLSGLVEASAQQIYLKSRLQLLKSYFSERTASREAIQEIFSLSLPGVTISSASFESDSVINLKATANDVLNLANLVDYFSNETDYFLQTVSKSLHRLDTGGYQMELLLTIPKES